MDFSETLAKTDFLLAATLPTVNEACGIALAMQTTGLPYIITANLHNTGEIEQMNIFTYGSLMFERVWTVVVAGTYLKTNARLFGYQRRKIRGEAYPALVPGAADDQVDGVVYLDVGQRDAMRLDRFEGVFYSKKKERCLLPGGSQISAWVYVFKEEYADRVEARTWDPVWFAKNGLHAFTATYQGYRWIDDDADEPES
jgi:gamma-glutamylcyclotransferase (GGCT)/AIG2-like uncharacterized protein YtfP